ncbi:hypothetical protein NMY3_01105 [Candidatus Nitrosocosmicus oleophilus]|uniref:Uncharacterized protein n=1 Tax=Candidatus Nitrosocosmicus oleophilus TaxID=1353260 RepID=A0A654LWW2_9ARCH|nr:hypothetical protein NMY3_01105 [Candidatus Nitrosocosmicus oleophilus]
MNVNQSFQSIWLIIEAFGDMGWINISNILILSHVYLHI